MASSQVELNSASHFAMASRGQVDPMNQSSAEEGCVNWLETERQTLSLEGAQLGRRQRRTSLLAGANPETHSHRIPGSQYAALAVWTVLLLGVYGFTRFLCNFDIPQDCTDDSDITKVMRDFEYLLFSGCVLAVLTGLHWPDRFQYVFCLRGRWPRGVSFVLIVFMSSLVWGLLGKIPGLTSFSLTQGMSANYIFLLGLLSLGALVVAVWHVGIALKHNSWYGFFAYMFSRAAIVVFYLAHIWVNAENSGASFHFHHYIIGYVAASFAEFNHPVSFVLLAVGTGIYVQGIAAYDADPILERHKVRIIWRSPQGKKMASPLVSQEAADYFIDHCQFVDK